jgi:hypothetical protein
VSTTYRIVRFYKDDDDLNRSEIDTGLSLEEAQDHCNDAESSSETATSPVALARTEAHGPWFDGYYEEA